MIKIGILGLGTVGSGVVKIMDKNRGSISRKVGTGLEIEKILVNNPRKNRDIDVDPGLITDDIKDIVDNPEIDLVVELIGGEEPAREYIIRAIKRSKSVVTANKLVIAKYGQEILSEARKHGVQVSYEGSVAGGLPIIRPLKESLAANRIEEIYGILNGTTNYILTRMTRDSMDFKTALAQAQERGYAERDSSSDINGDDAAYKITILSSLAFERFVDIDSVYVEGIKNIDLEDIQLADELGYVIKLLAIGKKTDKGLDVRVHPAFLPKDHQLALVNDVYNSVYLHGDAVGDVMSTGKGAGQMPTGSAVVADIIQVAKDIYYERDGGYSVDSFKQSRVLDIGEIDNSFYLRLQVNDKPGVMAQIARVFGDHNVSLASVLQKHRLSPVVPLVLVTHPVQERNLHQSLDKLRQIDDVIEINSVIRVEDDF